MSKKIKSNQLKIIQIFPFGIAVLLLGLVSGYHLNSYLLPKPTESVLGASDQSEKVGDDFEVKEVKYSAEEDTLILKGYVSDTVYITLYSPRLDITLLSSEVVGDWEVESGDLFEELGVGNISLDLVVSDGRDQELKNQQINFTIEKQLPQSYIYWGLILLFTLITYALYKIYKIRLSSVGESDISSASRSDIQGTDIDTKEERYTLDDYVENVKDSGSLDIGDPVETAAKRKKDKGSAFRAKKGSGR